MTDESNGKRSLRIRVLKFLLLVFLFALAVYMIKFRPVEVHGFKPVRAEIRAEVMGTGTLESDVSTIVSSKIPGRIIRLAADEGDRVETNDILVKLDDSELKQQVGIARANLEVAQAATGRIKAEIVRSEAIRRRAKNSYDRFLNLYNQKTVAHNELDEARKNLGVADADLASSRARMFEAKKNLLAAQKNLEYRLARLEDTIIRAPFSGLVIRRNRNVGDVVVSGSSIYLLISTHQLVIEAWVDETEMSGLEPGRPARVVYRSEPEKIYFGILSRIGRETDRETRQFLVDIKVSELPEVWSVGQRAEVFIEMETHRDALVVPADFLYRRPEGPGVFLSVDGRAIWQPVELGLWGEDKVEVVKNLTEEDLVIRTSEPEALTEGRRIQAVQNESGL